MNFDILDAIGEVIDIWRIYNGERTGKALVGNEKRQLSDGKSAYSPAGKNEKKPPCQSVSCGCYRKAEIANLKNWVVEFSAKPLKASDVLHAYCRI